MYYVVINPASRSGRGTKIWAELEPALTEKKIQYTAYFSTKAGHVTEIVKNLCDTVLPSSEDALLKLIILGGDGTMNEALQGITDFKRVHLGYIPTGSSNDMARDLQVSKNVINTLERILSCKEPVPTDIGCVTFDNISETQDAYSEASLPKKRYFAVSCGIGFDAAVCEEALTSRFKRIMNKIGLGKLTYLGIALKQIIAARKISCEFTVDDDKTITLPRFLFIAGMVHQYEGGGFKFCPGADSHDGILDICSVGNVPKPVILCALPTAFWGGHYRFNGVERYAASKLTIKTSAPLWIHTDGEVFVKTDAITMTCVKDRLLLLW